MAAAWRARSQQLWDAVAAPRTPTETPADTMTAMLLRLLLLVEDVLAGSGGASRRSMSPR